MLNIKRDFHPGQTVYFWRGMVLSNDDEDKMIEPHPLEEATVVEVRKRDVVVYLTPFHLHFHVPHKDEGDGNCLVSNGENQRVFLSPEAFDKWKDCVKLRMWFFQDAIHTIGHVLTHEQLRALKEEYERRKIKRH